MVKVATVPIGIVPEAQLLVPVEIRRIWTSHQDGSVQV
jgi:hypothetical protein